MKAVNHRAAVKVRRNKANIEFFLEVLAPAALLIFILTAAYNTFS